MLLMPVLGLVIAAVAVSAAVAGVTPNIFELLQDYIWYVVIGLVVIALASLGIGGMMGKSSGTPKAAKPKKDKKKKKAKKAKKK